MSCDHRIRNITGIYSSHGVPVAVGWDCCLCKTSGAVKWAEATEEQRAEAILAERSRLAVDGMTG